jgi:PAS domain S-box-containing protein
LLGLTRKDGSVGIVEISTEIITIKKEKVVLGMVKNITTRKQAEVALQDSEQKYQAVLEANPDPVVVYDMEGKVIYFNPAFTRVFGWSLEERVGQKMDDFVPKEHWPETKKMIEKITESRQTFSGLETCRYTREGKIIPVSISGSFYEDPKGNIAASIINLRDISKQKKLETQIQQTQKMEAVGTLAGGIAHDFNNILSAIIGYTELAINDIEKETLLYHHLQELLRATMRAKELVRQILTFSRQAEYERKPVQIKLIVKEALKLLRASLPTTVEIRQELQSDELVMADPTQIHQVMMNLCTNAEYAMRQKGGLLTIKLENIELDAHFTSGHQELSPGAYLNLMISDTGCGMPDHVLKRIFDPFFTTKEAGEGTGLGLSVVHGIIAGFGGAITAYSEPGKGSVFKIYLPIIERPPVSATIPKDTIPFGCERILFVDDEPALASVGKQILESLGYDVATRTSSVEALELFKARPHKFDLVITDMTMPHMTGEDLAAQLMLIKPGIPVILCTGFSAKINDEKAMAIGVRAFVSKPVPVWELAETIRNVLDGR